MKTQQSLRISAKSLGRRGWARLAVFGSCGSLVIALALVKLGTIPLPAGVEGQDGDAEAAMSDILASILADPESPKDPVQIQELAGAMFDIQHPDLAQRLRSADPECLEAEAAATATFSVTGSKAEGPDAIEVRTRFEAKMQAIADENAKRVPDDLPPTAGIEEIEALKNDPQFLERRLGRDRFVEEAPIGRP